MTKLLSHTPARTVAVSLSFLLLTNIEIYSRHTATPVNGALTKDTTKKIVMRWIEVSDRHPLCSSFWLGKFESDNNFVKEGIGIQPQLYTLPSIRRTSSNERRGGS